MEKSVKLAVVICASIIVVAVIAAFVAFNLASAQKITVTGQSQLKVVPDRITIYLTIQNKADNASAASTETSKNYDAFVAALVSAGIPESEVQTTNFQVTKNYEWQNNIMVEKGYIATHDLKIEFSSNDTKKVSSIIDAAVNSNVLINSINFELSDALQAQKKSEAIKQATEDAKTKAESIAKGLGSSLGGIVSVSDSSFNYYPWPLYQNAEGVTSPAAAGASASQATTSINPGEQTVSATVQAIYRIR